MTSEQKVKKLYPDATCVLMPMSKVYRVYPDLRLSGNYLGENAHRRSWAWANAIRSIKAVSNLESL